MALDLSPPAEQRCVSHGRMTRDQRAYASWLAIRAGWPLNQATWFYIAEQNLVVVSGPRLGASWGSPFGNADQVLAAIEAQFGPAKRKQAEGAIGT